MVFNLLSYLGLAPIVFFLIVMVCLWEAAWKGIALWKSGKNKQLAWFVILFIFNTAGILPIIYILFFQKKRAVVENKSRRKKKR